MAGPTPILDFKSLESSEVVAARFGLSGSYVREVRRGEVRKAG